MKKFNTFVNEKNENDPYNEERWDDKESEEMILAKKRDLVGDCTWMVINDIGNFRNFLTDILRDHFNQLDINTLEEFLGKDQDPDWNTVECPECEGSGLESLGVICDYCGGTGRIQNNNN